MVIKMKMSNFDYTPELYDLQVNWQQRLSKEKEFFEKIFAQKLSLQKRSGFNPHHVKIPARFFSVPSPHGLLEEGKLRQMIKIYCENYFDAQP